MEMIPDIPGYKIEKKIGEGGAASVYLGVQEKLKRKVAIKVLKPSLLVDESFGKRFLREAEIVSNLSHPNIVTIFDLGQSGDFLYIIMEFLGESLRDLLSRSIILPVDDALDILRHLAGALDYAHSKGVLHRDIKPGNIMSRENGAPVIADFGLALSAGFNSVLTASGVVMGTLSYMSPEQCKGERGEPACDFYSLGVVLFECLTGKVPYTSETQVGLLVKHMNDPVPFLPAHLSRLQPLIDRLMAKQKTARIQHGKDVIRLIDDYYKAPAVISNDNESTVVMNPAETPKSPGFSLLKRKKTLLLLLLALALVVSIAIALSIFQSKPAPPVVTPQEKVETPPTEVKKTIPVPKPGMVSFSNPTGEYKNSVSVKLNFLPFKSPSGDVVESELYYSLNGKDPDPSNGTIYTGNFIEFSVPGVFTIKARVLSKDGRYIGNVYSQVYVIKGN